VAGQATALEGRAVRWADEARAIGEAGQEGGWGSSRGMAGMGRDVGREGQGCGQGSGQGRVGRWAEQTREVGGACQGREVGGQFLLGTSKQVLNFSFKTQLSLMKITPKENNSIIFFTDEKLTRN